MKASTVDDKRRVVMPSECPPGSRVTIEQLDTSTWIIRRQGEQVRLKRVFIPVVETLPRDSQWDRVEKAFGRAAYKKLRQNPPRD